MHYTLHHLGFLGKLALAVLILGTLLQLIGVGPAHAANNRLCHSGSWSQPPLQVLESDGSKYKVYPGECTDRRAGIFGIKPVNIDSNCSYTLYGSTKRYILKWTTVGQWTGTSGRSVSVKSCWYNYGE